MSERFLVGKTALVTGSTSGIGSGLAQALAKAGANVVLNGFGPHAQAVAEVAALGVETAFHGADMRKASEIEAMMQFAAERFGRIDVLVNNAGITQDARLQKMTIEQFDRVIDVNLRGVFHFSQAVADAMVKQGSGVILNASSVVGIYGNFGQTNYVASKSGVIGFTKTWARELGPKGIRVNAVAPGFIDTPMIKTIPEKVLEAMQSQIPLRRMGTAEEIANAYAFLASDEASYINGVVLEVTGGATV